MMKKMKKPLPKSFMKYLTFPAPNKSMYTNNKVSLSRKGNTKVENDDHYLIVTLYNTNVLVIDKKNATIKLNSGGWRTVTTKQRINQASEDYFCGFRVFQKNFDWYVTLANGDTVPFVDGMKLDRFTGKRINE